MLPYIYMQPDTKHQHMLTLLIDWWVLQCTKARSRVMYMYITPSNGASM